MKDIKHLIKSAIKFPSKLLVVLLFLYERILAGVVSLDFAYSTREYVIRKLDDETQNTQHRDSDNMVKFGLHTPNRICYFRHKTFSSKEPEMLEWINEYGGDGAFYDIGANIGIYSIYYAKVKSGNVYSFEPSIFNLRQLGKNISLNSLSDRVTIIPNPLSSKAGVSTFKNSDTTEGGALNAFGVDYGHDGKKIISQVEYSVLGFSLDELIDQGVLVEAPALLKIDVDGIEHLILEGAKKTLSKPSCKSVFVEVNDDFVEQSDKINDILTSAGFILSEKRQSDMIEESQRFQKTFNQIWVKKGM
jgi:FkbM family methyltransferase